MREGSGFRRHGISDVRRLWLVVVVMVGLFLLCDLQSARQYLCHTYVKIIEDLRIYDTRCLRLGGALQP